MLNFLDGLNYNYQPDYSHDEELLINQALNLSNPDFEEGRSSSHDYVMKRVKKK